jgi:hypothetical protein
MSDYIISHIGKNGVMVEEEDEDFDEDAYLSEPVKPEPKTIWDYVLDLALEDDEFDKALFEKGIPAIIETKWGQKKLVSYLKRTDPHFLRKLLPDDRGKGRGPDGEGWMPEILCPWHELTGKHTPSLRPNITSGAFYCHGCGKKGTFSELVEYSDKVRYVLPLYIYDWVDDFKKRQGQKGVTPSIQAVPWDRIKDDESAGPGKPLIEGLLPSGENAKVLILSRPKGGKTTLGLSICVPTSKGEAALKSLEVTRPLRIAYGNFEQKGTDIGEQILRMKPMYGLPPSDMLHLLPVKGLKLNRQGDADAIMGQILANKYDLVFLDSAYKAIEDINDTPQVNAAMEFFSDVVEKAQCALIITHHTKESGESRGGDAPLGKLGNELERWCGSLLVYSDIAESLSVYYGRLKGEIRSGIGIVDYAVAYTEVTDSTQIVPWESVPVVRGTEIKLVRKQARVRVLQQLVIAAEGMGYKRTELAKALQVADSSLHEWFYGEKEPGEESWKAIQQVRDKLEKTGRLD